MSSLDQLHKRSVAAIAHYWSVSPKEAEDLILRLREHKSVNHQERTRRLQQRNTRKKEKVVREQQNATDSNIAALCSVCGEFAIYLNKNDEVVCTLHFTTDDFS